MSDLLQNYENCTGTASGEADEEHLKKVPTLVVYLNRVGAKPVSFRKFIIESEDAPKYGKLRKITGTITLEKNGTVDLPPDVEPPTDGEIAAIKAEVANAKLPENFFAQLHGPLPERLSTADRLGNIFKFLSSDGKKLNFIQERRDNADGTKSYIPWSFWSDGKWRCMEPDGLLPLYGLNRLGSGGAVFLHEGAKAARYVQWMIDQELEDAKKAYAAHPWGPALSCADHLGWIGGAPNPHRTDWSPIRSLPKDTPIYVVADNDQVGIDAVSSISRMLKRRMTAVVFNDDFESGFDMAVKWPTHEEWWQGERYIGPSLDDLSRPATWATDKQHPTGPGRPPTQIRDEFAAEWHMSSSPHLFVHRTQSNKLLTAEVFNRCIAPFSDVTDTAQLLAKRFSSHAEGIAYRPQRQLNSRWARAIEVEGRRLINTFRPSEITPARGNMKPWLRFMVHLIPDKGDREKVLRWCATLISRPDVRMRYALLLISSTQGVGKTTLGEAILAPLVGRWNVSFPNEKQVTDSAFNSWVAHKRLAIISEIYSGQSRKCYDNLKGFITDTTIDVERKYLESYTVDNWVHIVACSNSIRALHLDDGDRRWLVPRVTEETRPKEWWLDFYAWLNGEGLPIIAGWAEAYVATRGAVPTGEHAPTTTTKDEVIAESRSDGQQLAYDLARDIVGKMTEKGEKIVLRVDEVRDWVAGKRNLKSGDHRMERLLTIRKALEDGGMKLPPRRSENNSDRRVKIGARWQSIVANFEIEPGRTWKDDIELDHKTPEALEDI